MKKLLVSLFLMMLCNAVAFAQVKTYKTVVENDVMVVNASDCIDRLRSNYLLWVRYDYKNAKDCKKEAKRDGVVGKPVRAEVLYEIDEPLLTYRIISKKYYDKKDVLLKEIRYFNAPWNQVGDFDFSLKICIYMTGEFHITAG